eukprot:gb/GECG01009828.1/.p1 GENE.gb/GECG01009828.1/~~gb/GECG01009828.1/.p1  ORF type:complete len:351 (+),score=41.26 gb/GECG01009828.1/:1-1053(+)
MRFRLHKRTKCQLYPTHIRLCAELFSMAEMTENGGEESVNGELPMKPLNGKTNPLSVGAVEIPPNVAQAYRAIHAATGSVGGNGTFGPIYGEITIGSMHKVLTALNEQGRLGETTMFLDIGSGLGKPSIHAAAAYPIKCSIGVEVEKLRYYLSLVNLQRVLDAGITLGRNKRTCNVAFLNADILNLSSLQPMTHIFLFDVGMPSKVLYHLGELFNKSDSARFLICFKKPALVEEYGFHVRLVDKISVAMTCSAEVHTCFVYYKRKKNVHFVEAEDAIEYAIYSCEFRSLTKYKKSLGEEIAAWRDKNEIIDRRSRKPARLEQQQKQKTNEKRARSSDPATARENRKRSKR